MDKLTKKQRTRLERVTDELYRFAPTNPPKKDMRKFEAPSGSFVFSPYNMPKKDFQFFVVRWMDLMEERIKKAKANKKRKRKKKKLSIK